jgi:hypothetical protein
MLIFALMGGALVGAPAYAERGADAWLRYHSLGIAAPALPNLIAVVGNGGCVG